MTYQRLTTEELVEINKRRREEEHARNVERAPKPQPPPPASSAPSEEALRQALRIGPPYPAHIAEHFRRFGAVIIENLPDTGPRGPGGDLPSEDASISEADKIKAYKTSPQRIDALEARIARIEDIQKRQLGDAYGHGGEGYR
jgi:hypothetical protein